MVLRNMGTKWDLSPLFGGDDDAKMLNQRKAVEEQTMAFVNKWKGRSDYLKDATVLKKALDEYEEWVGNYGTSGGLGYYFSLRLEQEQDNPKLKAKMNQVVDFSNRLQNEILFFELRLAKISIEKQKYFLTEKELEPFKHWLEKLFAEARYLLGEREERILNLKSATAYGNWVRMTQEFLSKEERVVLIEDGKRKKLDLVRIMSLFDDRDKQVRDGAARVFNQILDKHLDMAEIELNSVLQDKKVNDELRGFVRPDSARHLADDIETEVVDALIKSVAERFDISQRYYVLKARLMGMKKLAYHERNVPYGKFDVEYSWREAVDLVSEVFRELDSEFGVILDSYIRNGQIDVFPEKGKNAGAFCAHDLIIFPTYILLNHTNKLKDVRTLAHEVGHGIHNELMKQKQKALNFGTPKSMAEVASTFMEDFVLDKLSKKVDDELRLTLNISKLNDDVSTIFRQVACYKFEQELHQSYRQVGYLSKKQIGVLFQKHMQDYMGEAVEQSSGSENWWVYWSHIRSFFYNYSYASGLLISRFLQRRTRADGSFVVKVKECLANGTSASPKQIFGSVGIDIADGRFWQQGLDEVDDLLYESELLADRLGK
jgi:oligoendopeptidase F